MKEGITPNYERSNQNKKYPQELVKQIREQFPDDKHLIEAVEQGKKNSAWIQRHLQEKRDQYETQTSPEEQIELINTAISKLQELGQ